MMFLRVLILCVLALPAAAAEGEFYRWVDRDGREFITNEREKIPAEYRESSRPFAVRGDRVSVEQQRAPGPRYSSPAVEHRDRNGRGEEYWRKRADRLRKELQILRDDHEELLRQLDADAKDTRPRKAATKKSQAKREKRKQELERQIARKEHELTVSLPEEARRADAYPGWVRE